ncbi:hypothetical protein [Streptomyces sp. NBC_01477]|uniref:hypothetical protein n=1 Tax=Streptomyces sp. NBC_01477 TaxID=2976015 RepID=UPI002E2F954C|nr:hypothetical protein [Streptomyces sp. NBC_01477]
MSRREARLFFDQLRALEARAAESRRTAGKPHSRRAAEAELKRAGAGVDARRISTWLPEDPAAAQTPSLRSGDKVLALVRLWSAWAAETPDERSWTGLLERAQPVRLRGVSPSGTSGPGRPVSAYTDPFALEVHRSIEVAAASADPAPPALPTLPKYVTREHDTRLREVMEAGADGTSGLVVLVGGSSTGKTRACWEAVQQLPGGWRLWHPIDPSRPDAALAELAAVTSRTVLWLNECQHYLLTPVSEVGERVAAKLRELMRDPARAPVVVLATLWPEHWARLATPPRQQLPDPHSQARALLTGRDLAVPATFGPTDMATLQEAAVGDPRLKSAADHAEQGQIAQYLAAAPALLDRYRTAPDGARALIEAAMDARRLGHGPALPLSLLEAAAEGYLTDVQWDHLDPESWLGEALDYATEPLRGARGPLTLIRRRGPDGETPDAARPQYRLSDYLEQQSRGSRVSTPVPAIAWQALTDHGRSADHTKLALAAYSRGLLRIAVRLCTSAPMADSGRASAVAVGILRNAGRLDEAMLVMFQRAAQAGDPHALAASAAQLRKAGREHEALTWLRARAESGNPSLCALLGGLLNAGGRAQEAADWLGRAAAGVEPGAPRPASVPLPQDSAVAAARTAGAEPRLTGRLAAAFGSYQRGLRAREPRVLRRQAGLLGMERRLEEKWGRLSSVMTLDSERANPAEDDGRSSRSGQGRTDAAPQRGGGERGDDAGGGRPDPAAVLAQLAQLREQAAAGISRALPDAAELLRRAGRHSEAESLWRYGWEPDGSVARPWQVRLSPF